MDIVVWTKGMFTKGLPVHIETPVECIIVNFKQFYRNGKSTLALDAAAGRVKGYHSTKQTHLGVNT